METEIHHPNIFESAEIEKKFWSGIESALEILKDYDRKRPKKLMESKIVGSGAVFLPPPAVAKDEPCLKKAAKDFDRWEKCNETVIWAEISIKNEQTATITMNVEARKAKYGTNKGKSGYLYWQITCSTLPPKDDFVWCHPFALIDRDHITMISKDDTTTPVFQIGEIIADNEHARNLLSWISKSDQELHLFTGSTAPASYRAKLIQNLVRLWD